MGEYPILHTNLSQNTEYWKLLRESPFLENRYNDFVQDVRYHDRQDVGICEANNSCSTAGENFYSG